MLFHSAIQVTLPQRNWLFSSFFLNCSFTRGNTEECHPKSHDTPSESGSPFPKGRQSASSILAGCWGELTPGSSYSQTRQTWDTLWKTAQPSSAHLHGTGSHLIPHTPRALLITQLKTHDNSDVATNKFCTQANKREMICGETVK